MANKTPKYRPSLSAVQIEHIVDTLQNKSVIDDTDKSCLTVLVPFLAKIGVGSATPAYVTAAKEPLADFLSGTSTTDTDTGTLTKEQYWEQCYRLLADKGAHHLSIQELEAANEWMYLDGVLTKLEQVEFEAGNLIINPKHLVDTTGDIVS